MHVELNTKLFSERVELVYDAWAVSYSYPMLPLLLIQRLTSERKEQGGVRVARRCGRDTTRRR